MMPFCPHCGYDLITDKPILLNDFSMLGPTNGLTFGNLPVPLTVSEMLLCWSLMKACPDPVRHSVILERLGSEGVGNSVQVFVCRIRKKLKAMGAPNPIESTRYRGIYSAYRWKLEA